MLAHIIKSENLVKQMNELKKLKTLLQELQEHTHTHDRESYIAANVKLYHVYFPDVEDFLSEEYCKKCNISAEARKYILSKMDEKFLADMWNNFCEQEATYFLDWLNGYCVESDDYWDAAIKMAESKEHTSELKIAKQNAQQLRRRLTAVDTKNEAVGFFGRMNGWFSFGEDNLEANICLIDDFFDDVAKIYNEGQIIIENFNDDDTEEDIIQWVGDELSDLYSSLDYTNQKAEDLLWLIEETKKMVKELKCEDFFEGEISTLLGMYEEEQEQE